MSRVTPVQSDEPRWLDLLGEKWQESWKTPLGDWYLTDSVALDPTNAPRLKATPGYVFWKAAIMPGST